MAIQLTNSVIAKNEPKNSNVKTFKKPKKLKNLNILSLKIIEKKQYYIYIYILLKKTITLIQFFFGRMTKVLYAANGGKDGRERQ